MNVFSFVNGRFHFVALPSLQGDAVVTAMAQLPCVCIALDEEFNFPGNKGS